MKILKLLIPLLLIPNLCFAAVGATTNWEIRTTGNNDNGAGFNATPFTSAPGSAPSLALTTGGTIANDTYYCVQTYVDSYGETAASAEAEITISDSTNDKIAITSPAAANYANTYKVYCGTVSGGPYFAQGAAVAVGTNSSITATPATSGDQPSMTDYSQQNAAQLSLTDLDCDEASNTTITSATGGFTQVMVGNIIKIKSGTNLTAGYYEIVGVTDTNTATIDRDATDGDGGDGGSDGVASLGGAAALLSTLQSSAVTSNILHVKYGTYTDNVTCASTGLRHWIGYKTSRLDNPNLADRPTISPSSGVAITSGSGVNGNIFYNFILSGAGGGSTGISSSCASAAWCYFYNTKITGFSGLGHSALCSYCYYCENSSNGANGASTSVSANAIVYQWGYVHDNTGHGLYESHGSSGSVSAYFTVSEANSGYGISGLPTINCINSISNGNTGATSDGFYSYGGGQMTGCAATNNGRYGFNGLPYLYSKFNLANGNATADFYQIPYGLTNFGNITTTPNYTDAANGDYTVTSSSNLIGAYYDFANVGLTGDYKWNSGLDQDDNAGQSSSGHFG